MMTQKHDHNRFGVKLLVSRMFGVAGAVAIAQVITGITYIFAARSLGPAELGRYVTAIAIDGIAISLFDMGMTSFLVREVAAGRMSIDMARRGTNRKKPLLLVIAPCLMTISFFITKNGWSALALGLYFVALWEVQISAAFLRSTERFTVASISMLCGRITTLTVVAVLIASDLPSEGLAFGLLIGTIVEAICNYGWLGLSTKHDVSATQVLSWQKESVAYGLISLSASAQQLDTPLVALGGGVTAAGLYGAAGRLLGPLGLLAGALNSVATPWLARAHNDPQRLRLEERKIGALALVTMVGPLTAAAIGPTVIPLLLGKAFTSSGNVFAILAIGATFSTLSQALAVMVQNRRSQGWVATSVACGLGIGLVATYFFALLGGATGAAWGFAVSQFITLCLLIIRLRVLRHHDNVRSATQTNILSSDNKSKSQEAIP